jgi:P4 family phage/plasmid primase-like protien
MNTSDVDLDAYHRAVVEAARAYAARGWHPVRLNEAKDAFVKGWTKRPAPPEEFRPGNGIGIGTGILSGGIVCADFDSPETLALADEYLPPTGMVEGRRGKERSHRYFVALNVPPEMVAKTKTVQGGPKIFHWPGIDLLGTGAQVSVPPTMTSTGPRYWEGGAPGEPAEIDYVDLVKRLEAIARRCGWTGKSKLKCLEPPAAAKVAEVVTTTAAALTPQGPAPRPDGITMPIPVRVRQAKRWLAEQPPAVEGQKGRERSFLVCRDVTIGFGLGKAFGWPLVRDLYNPRCGPPWAPGDLEALWDQAEAKEPHPEYPRGWLVVYASPNDPARLADSFIGDTPHVYWKNQLWRWERKGEAARYKAVDTNVLSRRIHRHIQHEFETLARWEAKQTGEHATPSHVDGAVVSNTLRAAESGSLPGVDFDSIPCHLSDGEPRDWLAVQNGLLDVATRKLLAPDPRWFSPVLLPYAFDKNAKPPERWLATLDRCLGGDGECIREFQEWCGYQLVRTTDAHKFMIMVGEAGTGKSTFCAVLEALVGADNCSHVPLEEFGKPFALVGTLGKLCNIVTEIGETGKTDEGRLKEFVVGDPMKMEEKYCPIFYATPTARLTIATNTLPTFRDKSNGVGRRLLLLPFTAKPFTDEGGGVVRGMDKAKWWQGSGEMPGILNWALDGLDRLRGQKLEFTEPAVCRAAKDEYRDEGNSARVFLKLFVKAGDGWLASAHLYRAYEGFCEDHGLTVLGGNVFGRVLVDLFRNTKRRQLGPERTPVYEGLAWQKEAA